MTLALAGCFWNEFDARVRMHTELLRDQARKGRDVVVAGRMRPEHLTELLYPLARGRAFAADARRRLDGRPGPAQLARFEQLLAAYARLCDAVDRARRAHPRGVPSEVLAGPLARVERRAVALLSAAAP